MLVTNHYSFPVHASSLSSKKIRYLFFYFDLQKKLLNRGKLFVNSGEHEIVINNILFNKRWKFDSSWQICQYDTTSTIASATKDVAIQHVIHVFDIRHHQHCKKWYWSGGRKKCTRTVLNKEIGRVFFKHW